MEGNRTGGEAPGTAPDVAAPSSDVPLPAQIGPYRILSLLGQGASAVVYLAEQSIPFRRRVALKLLNYRIHSESAVARFEQELRTLARLEHPYVARVYDFAAHGRANPYFTLEHAHGDPIDVYCDRHRLGVRERVELVVRVCEALEYVHRNGVIHRDVKPTNILVTDETGTPTPKIIDFGLAKVTGGDRDGAGRPRTTTGAVLGTPHYMSPEQAGVVSGLVDVRSDVYALGVLTYELLVGVTPFARRGAKSLADLFRLIRDEAPPRMSEQLGPADEPLATARGTSVARLRREVADELDWIVARAVAKAADDRYASVADFRAELGRFLADERVEARPPTWPYRARKFARRHRRALLFGCAASAIVLLAAALSFRWYLDVDRAHGRVLAALRLSDAVRSRVANAHLWLEEGLAGDPAVDVDRDVYRPLDESIALLRSGPAEPVALRSVEKLKGLTALRWARRRDGSQAGGDLDQEYDRLYDEIRGAFPVVAAGVDEDDAQAARRQLVRAAFGVAVAGFAVVGGIGLTFTVWPRGRGRRRG